MGDAALGASVRSGETSGSQRKKTYKKKVHWHTTFGEISVEEQTYYQPQGSSLLRPFLLLAEVKSRGYSLPLQRRITDFGADSAFGRVNGKLKEHYGISVPEYGIRTVTLHHATQLQRLRDNELGTIESPGKAIVISETDGSMVPIVQTKPGVEGERIDRRKGKALMYREARLTLAHEKGSKTPIFSATFGDVTTAGKHLLHCVRAVGVGKETKVHCVGDGAVWIANQMEEQLGAQARYLIDFFHLCEYLSAASTSCAAGHEKTWLSEQKILLKQNQWSQVLLNLQPHVEKSSVADNEAPVRACYRYIKNRAHQLDYKSAIENELPIGSGEVESAHRYVIQKRLKIAGAWWLEENAESMLALRTNRFNGQWDKYWGKKAA